MKRIPVLFFFSLLLCLLADGSFATVIRVNPTANSIHKAIDHAHRCDTLLLRKGYYKEHDITISKKLVIIGIDFPVIDAGGKFQGFIIKSDSVIIKGLQIQNIGEASLTDMAGIRIVNAKNIVVAGNRLINNTFGVYIQNSTRCEIIDNIINCQVKDEVNGGNGIHAWKAGQLLIKGNAISGHRDGIYFEFVTNSNITGNISNNNVRYGLHFMFSHNNTYTKNTFKDNGAGVAVMYSKGVTMTDNYFLQNWGDASYGLLLKEISNSKIEHNYFIKNTIGLYMETTTNVAVKKNAFQDNGWAMRIQASCSGGSFTQNNFIGNSFDVTTNGTMVMNTFSNNYWDRYDGYDLNKNNIGDVPYYPVSVYSVVTEKIPSAMILYRSLLTDIMDQVEKVMPTVVPDKLKDDHPMMRKIKL